LPSFVKFVDNLVRVVVKVLETAAEVSMFEWVVIWGFSVGMDVTRSEATPRAEVDCGMLATASVGVDHINVFLYLTISKKQFQFSTLSEDALYYSL
jgi:hypothetical protein